MIQTIRSEAIRETTALYSDVVYKNEGYWYGEAERPLKMSMLVPKHRKEHKPMPLLVFLCGGGCQVVDRNVWVPQLIRYAREGFVVASPEYRTDNDVKMPAPLLDVKAAIRFLKAHADRYCIDKNNVFLMGESAGGYLVNLAGTTMDLPEFEEGDFLTESTRVNGVIDIYGPSTGKRFQKEYYALKYVSKNSAPFLILHGTADTVVPISESEELYAALEEKGVPVDFYRLEDAIHGCDHFYQEKIEDIVLEFMRKNLK